MLPKITIITPTLNQAKYIERTLLSVINQGYPNLEYLVFDGGSKDGTLEILERYSGKLKWWSEPDRGQSHAINKGMKIAQGEIIGFINSDDEYEPGALLKVGRFFFSHPEAKWVTGRCKVIDPEGKEILPLVSGYKHTLLKFHHPYLLGVVNYIAQPATFWRREVVERIGLLDETLRFVMDYDYWLRISQAYRLFVIDDYLARFRFYPDAKTWQSALSDEDEEERVIRRYVKSSLILWLHRSHRNAINAIYTMMKR